MLDVGEPAPDFDLPPLRGPEDALYRLSAAARTGAVVVAFFSGNDPEPPVPLLDGLGSVDWSSVPEDVSIVGVGTGDPAAIAAFAAERDLEFPLLLDREGYVTDLFGIEDHTHSHGRDPAHRAIVVVDLDCRVRYSWRADDLSERPPVENVVEAVEAAGSP